MVQSNHLFYNSGYLNEKENNLQIYRIYFFHLNKNISSFDFRGPQIEIRIKEIYNIDAIAKLIVYNVNLSMEWIFCFAHNIATRNEYTCNPTQSYTNNYYPDVHSVLIVLFFFHFLLQ